MDSDGEFGSVRSDGFVTRSEHESDSDQDDVAVGFSWFERKRRRLVQRGNPIKSVKTEDGDGNMSVKQEEEGEDEEPIEKEMDDPDDDEEGAENSDVEIIEKENSVMEAVTGTDRNAVSQKIPEKKSRNDGDDNQDRESLTASPPPPASPVRPADHLPSRFARFPLTRMSGMAISSYLRQRRLSKPNIGTAANTNNSFGTEDDEKALLSALAHNALEKNEADLRKGVDELVSLQNEIERKLKEYRTGCASIRAKVDNVAKTCTDSIADKVNKEVISCLSDAFQIPKLAIVEGKLQEETAKVFSNHGSD